MTALALGRTGDGFAPTILIMAMDTPPWERRRLAGMRAKRENVDAGESPPPARAGLLPGAAATGPSHRSMPQ